MGGILRAFFAPFVIQKSAMNWNEGLIVGKKHWFWISKSGRLWWWRRHPEMQTDLTLRGPLLQRKTSMFSRLEVLKIVFKIPPTTRRYLQLCPNQVPHHIWEICYVLMGEFRSFRDFLCDAEINRRWCFQDPRCFQGSKSPRENPSISQLSPACDWKL